MQDTAPEERQDWIVFVNGPAGRRAHIRGGGIDVFEIIRTYRKVGGDKARLAAAYDWLSQGQLEAALAYYRTHPAEIDAWLADEAAYTPERVRQLITKARYGPSDVR